MEIFDLGIAWNEECDNEFVEELNKSCLKEGLKPYLLHAYNFYTSLKDIVEDKIGFQFFLNRTSNADRTFRGLSGFLGRKGIIFINNPDKVKKSQDKSVMHREFMHHFIPCPSAVVIKPQDSYQIIKIKLASLTKPFILKFQDSALVKKMTLEIESEEAVAKLREQYENAACFVQEKITPVNLEDKPASFRIFYCLAEIIPCWWHPQNHCYDILTKAEIDKFGLSSLLFLTLQIASFSQLDFFSTEMVLDNRRNFFVTDYVNDKPQMRKKSKFSDGIPDEVVDTVIKRIVYFVKEETKTNA